MYYILKAGEIIKHFADGPGILVTNQTRSEVEKYTKKDVGGWM